MMQKVEKASELVRNLITPLCALLEAARQGDQMRVQLRGENVVQIFEICGFHTEAQKLERSLS